MEILFPGIGMTASKSITWCIGAHTVEQEKLLAQYRYNHKVYDQLSYKIPSSDLC